MASLTDYLKASQTSPTLWGDWSRRASQTIAPALDEMRKQQEEDAQNRQIAAAFAGLPSDWAAQGAQKLVEQQQANEVAAQKRADVDAQNERYGTDLSWLDPTFQMHPELLGQSAGSQVYADQSAIDAQKAAYGGLSSAATRGYNFMDPSQQQSILNATRAIADPQYGSDAAQRDVYNQASAIGPGGAGLNFDSGANEGEQLGNLRDIVAGGGATAIEMANRQRQRADEESWLRGQREADLQNYQERGLSGSGRELLALAADRQASAGRNSLADLDTAKALEERRLSAINSAAGLSSTMRGETFNEQGLRNQRGMQALGIAANQANQLRSDQASEQNALADRRLAQQTQAANVASDMRKQQADEQTTSRANEINALQGMGSLAGSARQSSAQEGQYRANAADNFAQINQATINSARSGNVGFLQQAQQNMMQNRQAWEMQQNALKSNAAISQQQLDMQNANQGWNQANNMGMYNANAFNDAQSAFRGDLWGAQGMNQQQMNQARNMGYNATNQIGQVYGNFADTMASMGMGAMGGAGAAGAGGAAGGAAGATAAASAAKAGENSGQFNAWNEMRNRLFG